ncbi:MAG: aldehyde dehydrogenase family protein, partial [Bradymonadaceae bacterium]
NPAALDAKIQILQDNKDAWVMLSIESKIELARRLLDRTAAVAERQVAASVQAKHIPEDSPLVGEEWLGGPLVQARNIRLLIESLEDIKRYGKPQLKSGAVSTRHDGQVVARVFPGSTWDALLYKGFHAEVWMEPGVTPENLAGTMAVFYAEENPVGKVALVLGAGNVASIGPLDVVYKLFVEGQVCVLKMNPVNDYLGPFIEEVFADFLELGYFQMAYGGVDVGSYLTSHPDIDEIHITGSDRTHDAIVYGVGEEGKRRKAKDERLNDKRITSELGNVSPIIVVPGPWSDKDMEFQSENIATQLTNNAGFNCNAARVLITQDSWELRTKFLDTVRNTLRAVTPRVAYYPGAEERHESFVSAHSQAETYGELVPNVLPWGFIPDVDYRDEDNICFKQESFCGVMCETPLPGRDLVTYLKNAVDFCNDHVWGTLSASLLIHPETMRLYPEVIDAAVAGLRYGSVVVNHWPALSYGLGQTTWGAYPGHTFDDIQSGVGVVHNTYLFDRPQKSVIYGPFRVFPRPPWFVTNHNTHNIAPKLVEFERAPSMGRLATLLPSVLKG